MITGWNDINKMFEAMLLKGRLDVFYDDLGRSFGVWPELAATGYYPRTNLTDEGENFILIAELPGIEKDDLQVKIQGNYLEISGVNKLDAPEGYSTHRSERKATQFTRSFTLPVDVDAGKVTATLKNGLLTLYLPKAEAVKPLQIAIS